MKIQRCPYGCMDNRSGMFSLVQFDGQRFYLTEIYNTSSCVQEKNWTEMYHELGFDRKKTRAYNISDEFADALSKGQRQ
jgi:hypothetical protein